MFRCSDGKCISSNLRCNFFNDCEDYGSDEVNCTKEKGATIWCYHSSPIVPYNCYFFLSYLPSSGITHQFTQQRIQMSHATGCWLVVSVSGCVSIVVIYICVCVCVCALADTVVNDCKSNTTRCGDGDEAHCVTNGTDSFCSCKPGFHTVAPNICNGNRPLRTAFRHILSHALP